MPESSPTPRRASGSFEVSMQPLPARADPGTVELGRMALDKRFSGDMAGLGRGEMLTARTPLPGSAGYVAIERFSGTLHGRAGSFVLQHSGTMSAAGESLTISVVPDSGTDALSGIEGRLTIRRADGQHFYAFDYTLPD